LKKLLRRDWARTLLARALAFYLRAVFATTRWSIDGTAHLEAAGTGFVAAFWHERLALMPALLDLWRERTPDAPLHVLVSQSRDGRLIAATVAGWRLGMVHGSRSRGGATGLRALLRLLEAGTPVAITPDGPRGPRRQAAPGVAQLAALAAAPVLPCAARTSRGLVLGSWDRMVLPLPFARGVLVVGAPIRVRRDAVLAALPTIEAALTAACDRADALAAA
jgi:lysophospholipid acyltransferase (LPLAT)-like uncharacterized protein